MSSKCSLLLLLGLAIAVSGKLEIPRIQRLKEKTDVLSAQNPANAPICFDIYRPELDSVSAQYEVQYTKCNNDYAEKSALEDSHWEEPRHNLEVRGANACNLMSDCSTIVGYVESFECYAQRGAEQSKTMYNISVNATEQAVEIKEFYREIETAQTICIKNAERTYVEDTTVAYEALNNCLSGKTPPTTTARPTTGQPTSTNAL